MARLTERARKRMPDSTFAGPDRSYPVNDRKHAIVALGFAKMHGASPATVARIKAKARQKGVDV